VITDLPNKIINRVTIRIAVLVLVIGLSAVLIFQTAVRTWHDVSELGGRLTRVQLESFRIADHIQRQVLELSNHVLQYAVEGDQEDLDQFRKGTHELDGWLDEQIPKLRTAKEKEVLNKLNIAFDQYVKLAERLEPSGEAGASPKEALRGLSELEGHSEKILNLGYELAEAHRASLDLFLSQSKTGLAYLRNVLLVSLCLLLSFGTTLAVVVYREMIAPLRLKLVESQALLERQEKLVSLGMLAAGVAHEIRNPLTAIKACLFLQQKRFKPGSAEFADVELVGREISRLEKIVKDFLQFARPAEPEFTEAEAVDLLGEVQLLLGPQLQKQNIRLEVENESAACVRVDRQQIKQVLINLVQNSAESIKENGTISLGVREGMKRWNNRQTEAVVLEVADTGSGILPEVEKRLFDPFFTTKESGTGLGLSIAARIVEKHGGALEYRTEVNRGTVFGIVLPRIRNEPARKSVVGRR
jgi:signal transduction histidine kinase